MILDEKEIDDLIIAQADDDTAWENPIFVDRKSSRIYKKGEKLMEITINLPEDVANVFLANGESLEREILEATALEGYRTGILSHAQVGRMLNLNRFEVDEFFKNHDVTLNYTIEDLEADRQTLDKLFSK